MATTDDLIISLRADVTQLQNQPTTTSTNSYNNTQHAGEGAAQAVNNIVIKLACSQWSAAMESLQNVSRSQSPIRYS